MKRRWSVPVGGAGWKPSVAANEADGMRTDRLPKSLKSGQTSGLGICLRTSEAGYPPEDRDCGRAQKGAHGR